MPLLMQMEIEGMRQWDRDRVGQIGDVGKWEMVMLIADGNGGWSEANEAMS